MELDLSDGETTERLWSFLRPFNEMTKEMRPSHRVDILTHALMYYGIKTKKKLGKHYGKFCLLAAVRVHAINFSSTTCDKISACTSNYGSSSRNKLMSEGIVHWIACWLYVSIMLLCWHILVEYLTDDDIKRFLDEEQSLVREKNHSSMLL